MRQARAAVGRDPRARALCRAQPPRPHAHGRRRRRVPGMDWSGEVAEVGENVTAFKPGDRVMCMGAGGYAEYAAADAAVSFAVPADMGFDRPRRCRSRSSPCTTPSITNGRLQQGRIRADPGRELRRGPHGPADRQADRRGPRRRLVASRAARKAARSSAPTSRSTPATPGWVEALTAGDRAAKASTSSSTRCPASSSTRRSRRPPIGGRIVNVGRLGGMVADSTSTCTPCAACSYIGVTFRTRSADEVREVFATHARADLWPSLEAGKLRLPIDRVFPLSRSGSGASSACAPTSISARSCSPSPDVSARGSRGAWRGCAASIARRRPPWPPR